ncbi:N-acetyltransferase [Rhodotorula toruloides]|uniref:N-acetyltransferase n=1 Tax=Rhodotorula toruloides TaxID=5286 RepID=A0A511K880_RHOTO|nr:N-acetyltransferase [Rhodotorula toruloides]
MSTQIIECKIVDSNRKVLGSLTVWAFATGEFEFTGDFLSFMDEWSQESHRFSCLFDRTAKLRSRFAREGTSIWGTEVTDQPAIAYLEHMRIKPKYCNQGIGSWVLKQIWLPEEGVKMVNTDFLFVQPGALVEEFPPHDPFEPDPHREAKLAISDRITQSCQRNGFRRVGATSYFCLSFDPNHASRCIPITEDAKFVEDATRSKGELVGMLARGAMPW